MTSAIYQLNGVPPADGYIPGQNQWTTPMQVLYATLTCQPPTSGILTLSLEVGGVLTGFQFTVGAGTAPVRRSNAVLASIPANTLVRWKAAFTGTPEQAATQVAITMRLTPQSVSQVTAVPPVLTLQWVNAAERLTLFNYNATTHTFVETSPGISAGRASITQSGDTQISISIGATEVLRAAAGQLLAPSIVAQGGVTSTQSPRLSFCVDNVAVATVAADALRVVELTEGTPAALTWSDAGFNSRFAFYSGGMLTAVINATGLTALEVGEF